MTLAVQFVLGRAYPMQAYWLILLVGIVGILGVLLVATLSILWRRYNARQNPPPRSEPMPDIWQASGQRLIDGVTQTEIDAAHRRALEDLEDERRKRNEASGTGEAEDHEGSDDSDGPGPEDGPDESPGPGGFREPQGPQGPRRPRDPGNRGSGGKPDEPDKPKAP